MYLCTFSLQDNGTTFSHGERLSLRYFLSFSQETMATSLATIVKIPFTSLLWAGIRAHPLIFGELREPLAHIAVTILYRFTFF